MLPFLEAISKSSPQSFRIRIVVEHTISRLKKFRIMTDVFRNRLKRYDMVSDIVCGIVNFRIRHQDIIVVP
jgi:hypothetical protein